VKCLAIIPARGGSKRIPRKNIKEFCGRPMIAYSIDAAIKSGCFDEIMVSTEDAAIAEVAKRSGAVVPFVRSAANSDDHATLIDVIREVLTEYKQQGKEFDYYCCILSTAPFIKAERVKAAFEAIAARPEAESLIAVTRFGFPIQRAFKIDETGLLKMIWPENLLVRSQDLPPSFQDAGQFYWGRPAPILAGKAVLSDKTLPFEIPESEAQDIDSEADWRVAEVKYRVLQEIDSTVSTRV
jgi:N-acylneuraminate cytidylyltransferase